MLLEPVLNANRWYFVLIINNNNNSNKISLSTGQILIPFIQSMLFKFFEINIYSKYKVYNTSYSHRMLFECICYDNQAALNHFLHSCAMSIGFYSLPTELNLRLAVGNIYRLKICYWNLEFIAL